MATKVCSINKWNNLDISFGLESNMKKITETARDHELRKPGKL